MGGFHSAPLTTRLYKRDTKPMPVRIDAGAVRIANRTRKSRHPKPSRLRIQRSREKDVLKVDHISSGVGRYIKVKTERHHKARKMLGPHIGTVCYKKQVDGGEATNFFIFYNRKQECWYLAQVKTLIYKKEAIYHSRTLYYRFGRNSSNVPMVGWNKYSGDRSCWQDVWGF